MTSAPDQITAGPDAALLHEYRPIRRPQHFLWLAPLPLSVVFFLLTIVLADGADALFILGGLLIAGGFVGLTGIAYILSIWNNDLNIRVYSDRISKTHKGETAVIFWRELNDVTIKTYRTPRRGFLGGLTEFVLHGIGGKTIAIGAYVRDADLLVTIIAEVIRLYHLPAILERIHAGETVDFGAIKASSEGLQAGGVLAWDDIAYDLMETDDDRYRIITFGDDPLDLRLWRTFRLTDLKHIPLLVALINEKDALRLGEGHAPEPALA